MGVKIYTTGSNGEPTSTVHAALTNPSTIQNGTLTFTAPADTVLDASTTYAVVVSGATGGLPGASVARVSQTGETGEAGWTIADIRFHKASQSAAWSQEATQFLKMRLKGTVRSNNQPAFSAETATRTVPENSAAGVDVGSPVSTTDDDSDPLVYTLSGTDASSFTIVESSGQIQTVSGVDYDFEDTKNSYSVTVSVRDNKDEAGAADTAVDDTIDVTINLTDVNEPPSISGLVTANIRENTTTVGTAMVTDPDQSDTHMWSIEPGDDSALFQIGANSGVLSFINAPDYENPGSSNGTNFYQVTIKVTDNGSPAESTTRLVPVEVKDVNEAPVIRTAAVGIQSRRERLPRKSSPPTRRTTRRPTR